MPSSARSDMGTMRAIGFAAALAILAVPIILEDTFASMVRQWQGSDARDFSFLVLPAALFLAWTRRESLRGIPPRASALGVFASLIAATAWIIGYLTEVEIIRQVAAVSLLGLALWSTLGGDFARALIYPITFLFFMVPMGGFLVAPLMEWTADFTLAATRFSGVPIYRDGMYLSIPEGDFNVAEACSGLGALLVFTATGVFFAGINFQSVRRRIIFISISIATPIIANGVRAYSIVMLGHMSEMRWTENHVLIGDIWFGIVLVLMCVIGRHYSDITDEDIAPKDRSFKGVTIRTVWRSFTAAGVSILILVLIPISAESIARRVDERSSAALPDLPTQTEPWKFSPDAAPDWAPAYSRASRETTGSYQLGDTQIDAHLISYLRESNGGEMINTLNVLFDREHWRQVDIREDNIALPSGHLLPYIALDLRSKANAEHGRIVWYWYLIDDHQTVDPLTVKLRQMINLFATKKSVSSLVALSMRADENSTDTENAMEELTLRFCGIGTTDPGGARTSACGLQSP